MSKQRRRRTGGLNGHDGGAGLHAALAAKNVRQRVNRLDFAERRDGKFFAESFIHLTWAKPAARDAGEDYGFAIATDTSGNCCLNRL